MILHCKTFDPRQPSLRLVRRTTAYRVHDDQRLLEQKMLREHRSHATGAPQPRGHDGQVKPG